MSAITYTVQEKIDVRGYPYLIVTFPATDKYPRYCYHKWLHTGSKELAIASALIVYENYCIEEDKKRASEKKALKFSPNEIQGKRNKNNVLSISSAMLSVRF